MKIFSLIALSLLLVGCATTTELTPQATMIKEAKDGARVLCRMLGMVRGERSESSENSPVAAKDDARRQALNEAAAMGATHIMWRTAARRGSDWVVRARAYQCPQPEMKGSG